MVPWSNSQAVSVGIGMGVKVYQRHFAEMRLRMSTQQRQRNKVVTTEGEHALTASQQLFRMRLHSFRSFRASPKA